MKKIYSFLLAACAGLSLASCMNDDMESPALDYEQASITSTTDVGTTNIKVAALKDKYASTFRQANAWLKIEEDLVTSTMRQAPTSAFSWPSRTLVFILTLSSASASR